MRKKDNMTEKLVESMKLVNFSNIKLPLSTVI